LVEANPALKRTAKPQRAATRGIRIPLDSGRRS
jgi:hypothetical protein